MKNWNSIILSGILALSSALTFAGGKIDETTPGALAAKNFVNSVFTPAMKASGWQATGYGSSASPVQSLVWVTPGGDCAGVMSFLMDITNPSSPKIFYIAQGINSDPKHAYNGLISGAIKNIGLPFLADIVGACYDVDLIRDAVNASKGKKTEYQADEKAALRELGELYATGAQLKRSFGFYASGKPADAQKALPKPRECVTQSAPAAKPSTAVVSGHVPPKLPPRPKSEAAQAPSDAKAAKDAH